MLFTCSGPNDHVFVYFTDHGAPGLIAFPDSEVSLLSLCWFSCACTSVSKHIIYDQECNLCTICTEACANVIDATQIIFLNNNCKQWNVQHVLIIEQRKNLVLLEFQTHHLWDTRHELKYSVVFGETWVELTTAVGHLLGSYYVTSYILLESAMSARSSSRHAK